MTIAEPPMDVRSIAQYEEPKDLTIEEIEGHGFKIEEQLSDEGYFRQVYRAKLDKGGGVVEDLAAKIQRADIDISSVLAKAAMAKGVDFEEREVDASNQIWHNNVARVMYSIVLEDGRRVNFEPYFKKSIDLKKRVKRDGTYKDKQRLKATLEGIANGLGAIKTNDESHKDVRPSNIIIKGDGTPVVTDLQTVGSYWNYSPLPTGGGGTKYREPRLLNALLDNKSVMAGESNDVHGLGGIAYYMLTGEDPSDLKLEEHPSGSPVELGGETINVRVRRGSRALDRITEEDQKDIIKEMNKKMKEHGVSRSYRNFVKRCMKRGKTRFLEQKPIETLSEFKRELAKLDDGLVARFKDELVDQVPKYLGWGAGAGIFGAAITAMAYMGESMFIEPAYTKTVPAVGGMMQGEDNRVMFHSDISPEERRAAYTVLGPRIDEAKSWNEKYGAQAKDISFIVENFAQNVHQMNPRFTASWIRSCQINQEEGKKGYAEAGENRESMVFTPTWLEDYSRRLLPISKDPKRRVEDMEVQGIRFMKTLMDPGKKIVDMYAEYFVGEDRIRKAIAHTGSASYFPTLDSEGKVVDKGWRVALEDHKQDLIETARALYEITGEDPREIHWNRLKAYRNQEEN